MKKLSLLLTVIFMASCGRSHEEQLLYEYQQDNFKSSINVDVEDLNLQIHSIEKVEEIRASDSMEIYRDKLANLWSPDLLPEEKDTLTYRFVIRELDTLQKQYQELILGNIRLNREHRNYELKRTRDQVAEAHTDAIFWNMVDGIYSKNPDSILSIKYKASYSVNNPMLNNTKQTFDKYFYSNSENSKLIKEEMISDEAK